MLYRSLPERKPGKRGRPRKHGPQFALKEPETWGEPDEFIPLQHPRWGSVEIWRWNDLHDRQSVYTWFDVLQVQTHLEKDEPPAPLWLAWLARPNIPAGIHVDALPGTTDRAGLASTLAAITARSYPGESEKRHWIGFSRDCQSGITA